MPRAYGSDSSPRVSPSAKGPTASSNSVRGGEENLGSRDRLGNQAAVGPQDGERPGPDREEHVAGTGGVEDAPALDLAGGNLEFGLRLAVHQTGVPPPAFVPLLEAPEAGEVALAVELEIVQNEHPLAVEMRLVVAAHDQRPVQALLQLHSLVDVGVVPERPRIRQHEPVLERLPGLDGLLHQLSAVHLGWDAQSVPVNARRLGKGIGQVNDQRVADLRLDGEAGHLPVEPIPRHDVARRDLPLGLSGLKPDGHRLPGARCVRTHRSLLPSPRRIHRR